MSLAGLACLSRAKPLSGTFGWLTRMPVGHFPIGYFASHRDSLARGIRARSDREERR